MKLQMARNSLFAILLRSPWWASGAIAVVLALLGGALLPEGYRAVGAMSSLPFVVICAIAARRQWGQPGTARVAQVAEAVAGLPWPAFAALLEQAFVRDGYQVRASAPARRGKADAAADFELERNGRKMLVAARRWKSAQTGVAALQALQQAREAAGGDGGDGNVPDALYIGLGELTDGARAFASEHRITVWQAAELAQALQGLALPAATGVGARTDARSGGR